MRIVLHLLPADGSIFGQLILLPLQEPNWQSVCSGGHRENWKHCATNVAKSAICLLNSHACTYNLKKKTAYLKKKRNFAISYFKKPKTRVFQNNFTAKPWGHLLQDNPCYLLDMKGLDNMEFSLFFPLLGIMFPTVLVVKDKCKIHVWSFQVIDLLTQWVVSGLLDKGRRECWSEFCPWMSFVLYFQWDQNHTTGERHVRRFLMRWAKWGWFTSLKGDVIVQDQVKLV